ncbi:hypothetical protein EYF80_026085 [Liparis tanakae]|uniref:Uncharacterized protein n=1 Tax=Liparis tanakae TaxID=230148 RepID=A0A4Z2HCQ2_9TELE|nr:hypothetical protein EYF80_026085 [Liparis tanakae]
MFFHAERLDVDLLKGSGRCTGPSRDHRGARASGRRGGGVVCGGQQHGEEQQDGHQQIWQVDGDQQPAVLRGLGTRERIRGDREKRRLEQSLAINKGLEPGRRVQHHGVPEPLCIPLQKVLQLAERRSHRVTNCLGATKHSITTSVNEGLSRYRSSQQSRMIWSLKGFHSHGIHRVLHGQSDVIGGNGEQALQLGVGTQADPVALQEGLQGATAHVLHDQKVNMLWPLHVPLVILAW